MRQAPPIRRAQWIILGLGVMQCLGWAQTDDERERDLWFHKDRIAEAKLPTESKLPAKVAIPRSYGLVIGVSNYKNLPERGQLKFADRDAAEIYATLISPEGGQFPPENVHTLIGPQATLPNIRKELETWLPSTS